MLILDYFLVEKLGFKNYRQISTLRIFWHQLWTNKNKPLMFLSRLQQFMRNMRIFYNLGPPEQKIRNSTLVDSLFTQILLIFYLGEPRKSSWYQRCAKTWLTTSQNGFELRIALNKIGTRFSHLRPLLKYHKRDMEKIEF